MTKRVNFVKNLAKKVREILEVRKNKNFEISAKTGQFLHDSAIMQKSGIEELDTKEQEVEQEVAPPVLEEKTSLEDNTKTEVDCEEKEHTKVEVILQNDTKTADPHPRLEALVIPIRPQMMGNRNVGAFVDADTMATVLLRPTTTPVQPNRPSIRSTTKLKREHNVRDYTTFCDGVKMEEALRYVEHFRTATSVSEAAVERAVLEAETDADLFECEFGDETWVTPTARQVAIYHNLCSACGRMGISYNHRDFPETEREYRLAILSLSRAIKRQRAHYIEPIYIHNLN